MSVTSGHHHPTLIDRSSLGACRWMVASLLPALVVIGCGVLAVAAPIGVSIAAVFLFAGPHNWQEARYFLSRMPARWGRLSGYFSLGIGGTAMLGGMFASMPWLAGENQERDVLLIAVWNSLLMAWIMTLVLMRSRQNPRRDWTWIIPLGFGLIAMNWMRPLAWSVGLVYLHPLMALWFLDRELQRRKSDWRRPLRGALCLVPVCLIVMAALWAGSTDLPCDDLVAWQITHHAGAGLFPHVSTHFLVSAHIFLELLHYLVWILVIPGISQQNAVWQMPTGPLARRSPCWRRVITAVVLAGAVMMVALWGAFLTDYAATRNVYFTVAILHVLIEVPFLLRSL